MRVVLALVSVTLMSGIWAAFPQTAKPQLIGSGFNFPGDQTRLLKLTDANDSARHAAACLDGLRRDDAADIRG